MARVASRDRLEAALINRRQEGKLDAVVKAASAPGEKTYRRLIVSKLPSALVANGFGQTVDDPDVVAIVAETCGEQEYVTPVAASTPQSTDSDDADLDRAEVTRSSGPTPVDLVDDGKGLPTPASE